MASQDNATVPVAVLRRGMDLLAEFAERMGQMAEQQSRAAEQQARTADAMAANTDALRENTEVMRDVKSLLAAQRAAPAATSAAPAPQPPAHPVNRIAQGILEGAADGINSKAGKFSIGALTLAVVMALASWLSFKGIDVGMGAP